MKTIPQVRNELLELANSGTIGVSQSRKIKSLVKSLYRRPAIRRATPEHRHVTSELSASIRDWADKNPDHSYATIGRIWNVSIGRVSEAVAGKRTA